MQIQIFQKQHVCYQLYYEKESRLWDLFIKKKNFKEEKDNKTKQTKQLNMDTDFQTKQFNNCKKKNSLVVS